MGFGVPAAIGAAVATGRRAVAVVGDGGFAISGLELATAAGLGLPLTVIVFVDRAFGLIRLQQLRRTGYESGVDLPPLDLEQAAAAVSAAYVRVEGGDAAATLREAVERPGVSVAEVPVEQIPASARVRARGLALSSARTLLGERAAERLTDAARRRRGGA
jgi:acetolactate synthase-1/2/3 large subunit